LESGSACIRIDLAILDLNPDLVSMKLNKKGFASYRNPDHKLLKFFDVKKSKEEFDIE
jgi:hypothetical protein